MANIQKYDVCLHKYGLKNTRPRHLVLNVLLGKEDIVTAEDIYQELLRDGETVNESTIYRTLELFATRGLVEKTYLTQARRYGFSLRMPGHRHYLICIRCHKKVDIAACPLADFEAQVAAEADFTIVGHRLELYGLCRECREKEKRERKEKDE